MGTLSHPGLARSSGGRSRHRAPPTGPAALTSLATSSFRCRPYLATTGRSTSVTGLVGLALSPTDRLMGTRSSLAERERHGHAHCEPMRGSWRIPSPEWCGIPAPSPCPGAPPPPPPPALAGPSLQGLLQGSLWRRTGAVTASRGRPPQDGHPAGPPRRSRDGKGERTSGPLGLRAAPTPAPRPRTEPAGTAAAEHRVTLGNTKKELHFPHRNKVRFSRRRSLDAKMLLS